MLKKRKEGLKKLIYILILGTSSMAASYDCSGDFNKAKKLVYSKHINDLHKVERLIKQLDKNRCSIIGSDAEYELEVYLDKKIKLLSNS